MDEPELLEAYLSYYWPVSYAQAWRVLRISGLNPDRVLDLGSGPGPMAAAALDRGARQLCLVDRSAPALALAERLLVDPGRYTLKNSGGGTVKPPKTGAAAPADSGAGAKPAIQRIQADLEEPEATPAGPFDLVILGHCLNELGAELGERAARLERRAAVVRRAAGSLAPGGAVMIVDPATLASARDGLALRDHLTALGWSLIGPCTRQGPCPALAAGENHSCHDEADWDMPDAVQALAREAGLDRQKIKMFWLVLKPPATEAAEDRETASWDRAGSGGGEDHAESSSQTYRVVSEPMLNKAGRVRYLLCGPRGRFAFSAKRGDPMATSGGFFDLARYDLIRVAEPEQREGGAWGFGPDTRISVLLPPGTVAGTLGL